MSLPDEFHNNSLDNMGRIASLYEAYITLVNKEKRIFYDSLVDQEGENAILTFDNQDSINNFVRSVNSQLSYFYKNNSGLEKNISDLEKKAEEKNLEICKLEEMVAELSNLLDDTKKEKEAHYTNLCTLKEDYKEQHDALTKLNDIESRNEITINQNKQLLKRLRLNDIRSFKILAGGLAVFLFIFLLLYINI